MGAYLRPTEERKAGVAAPVAAAEPAEVTEAAEAAEVTVEDAKPKPRARTRRPPTAEE